MNASQRGFTLIEVVVTLALIGLLASMAAPLTETLVRRGKEQELRNALYQIRDAIDAYKRAFDAGYIEKSLNSSGYPPNLKVLVEGVRDVRSAKGAKFYFYAASRAIRWCRPNGMTKGLGRARLRQFGSEPARWRGRVRRLLPRPGQGPQRHRLSRVVNLMRREKGFTLLELMVVMAIIATLMTIALPRYFNSLEASKETTLRQSLSAMREALDHFYGDTGRYPDSIEQLIEQRYLRNAPLDPITERKDLWVLIAPPDGVAGGVADIKSGATGRARDGSQYSEW